MNWELSLTHPLILRSGLELRTLHDAAEAFLQSFGNVNHDYAVAHGIELMMAAARTGDDADRKAATEQVARVLKDNRLM